MATESTGPAAPAPASTSVPSKPKTPTSTTTTLYRVLKSVTQADQQPQQTGTGSVCSMWKTLKDAQAAARLELPYNRSHREYRETTSSLGGGPFEVSAINSEGEQTRVWVDKKKSEPGAVAQAPKARRNRIFLVTRSIREQKYDPHNRLKKANIAIYETLIDANRGARQHLLYDVGKLPPPGPEIEDVDAYDDASAKKFDDMCDLSERNVRSARGPYYGFGTGVAHLKWEVKVEGTDMPYFDPESAKAALRRVKPAAKRKATDGEAEGANKKLKGDPSDASDDDELDSSDEDSGIFSEGLGSGEEEEDDEEMWMHP
jgi:hypothetical protein